MPQNSVTYGDVTIEGQQAQPPAGHDDIAFRPACDQVLTTLQASGKVDYSINLPDGTTRILATYDNMPIEQANLYLDAEGLCKTGPDAIDVPIIYANQLPQAAVATGTATPANADQPIATTGEGMGMGGMVMGAIGLSIIGGVFYLMTQRKPKASAQKTEKPPEPGQKTKISDLTKW